MQFSVVVPVYGCREALPELHRRLVEVFEGMNATFEIVLVDDHDPYNSWDAVEQICLADPRVHGIKLARNFGQIRAITAGLDACKGDWVIVMDCDLQDRPEAIPQLYAKAMEGYDVVFAKRVERKDSPITLFFSRAFYKVYEYFTDGTYDASLCNFSIARRAVIENYCKMREHNRGYTMFIKWLGFNQTSIEIEGDERFAGSSSYSFSKKLAFLALLFLVVSVIRKLCFGDVSIGWTSLICSVFLMGGLILAAIGVVGLYVGNIFTEVKHRPLYVIEREVNN